MNILKCTSVIRISAATTVSDIRHSVFGRLDVVIKERPNQKIIYILIIMPRRNIKYAIKSQHPAPIRFSVSALA